MRRGDDILLVRQQGPDNPASFWALPGGVVEDGELLTETLAREVREETGLRVTTHGRLVYVAQLDNRGPVQLHLHRGPGPGYVVTIFVFEVSDWDGELNPNDPDGYVKEARFHPLSSALGEFAQVPYRMASEPIVAYLRAEAPRGSVWLYRRSRDGADSLIARLP